MQYYQIMLFIVNILYFIYLFRNGCQYLFFFCFAWHRLCDTFWDFSSFWLLPLVYYTGKAKSYIIMSCLSSWFCLSLQQIEGRYFCIACLPLLLFFYGKFSCNIEAFFVTRNKQTKNLKKPFSEFIKVFPTLHSDSTLIFLLCKASSNCVEIFLQHTSPSVSYLHWVLFSVFLKKKNMFCLKKTCFFFKHCWKKSFFFQTLVLFRL